MLENRKRLSVAMLTIVNPTNAVSRSLLKPCSTSVPISTPGSPVAIRNPNARQFTCLRAIYIGVVRIFTAAPKIRAVPTACRVGMPISRISSGVVIEPAPTPVSAMNIAMINPSAISIQP